MQKILIVGATSAIAMETAKVFAAEGAALFLVGRNEEKLGNVADDLKIRRAGQVETLAVDLNDLEKHEDIVKRADAALGGLDAALIAHGTLSDQPACQESVDLTMEEFSTNCLSYISLLTRLASYFEPRQAGCIAAITSVAGDRGRMSNYVYGAAKSGVSTFLAGLRHRLFESGVKVVTIKPGFVDTPMTADYKKGPLFASAETVGKGIYNAMRAGKGEVYLPGFWRLIMLVIRTMPEFVFKRTKL